MRGKLVARHRLSVAVSFAVRRFVALCLLALPLLGCSPVENIADPPMPGIPKIVPSVPPVLYCQDLALRPGYPRAVPYVMGLFECDFDDVGVVREALP